MSRYSLAVPDSGGQHAFPQTACFSKTLACACCLLVGDAHSSCSSYEGSMAPTMSLTSQSSGVSVTPCTTHHAGDLVHMLCGAVDRDDVLCRRAVWRAAAGAGDLNRWIYIAHLPCVLLRLQLVVALQPQNKASSFVSWPTCSVDAQHCIANWRHDIACQQQDDRERLQRKQGLTVASTTFCGQRKPRSSDACTMLDVACTSRPTETHQRYVMSRCEALLRDR